MKQQLEIFFLRLKTFKKHFFPTKYDKLQLKKTNDQIVFYKQFIEKGDLVFDIGANVGFKTNVFLKLGAKVVAVEPQINCVKILKQKFGKKINIEQMGLGAEESVKNFYVSNNIELSSFDEDWIKDLKSARFERATLKEVVQINITTLDNLIEKYGVPKFIKIDVEGFEFEVLKGLSKKPTYLSFEYLLPQRIKPLMNCFNFLTNNFEEVMFNLNGFENFKPISKWAEPKKFSQEIEKIGRNDFYAGDVYVKF